MSEQPILVTVHSHVGTRVEYKLRGEAYEVAPYGTFKCTEEQFQLLKSRGMAIGLVPKTAEERAATRTRQLTETGSDERAETLKRDLGVSEASRLAAIRAAEEAAAQQRAAESARDKAENALRTAEERAGKLQGEVDKLVEDVASGNVSASQSAELRETKNALKLAIAELEQLKASADATAATKTKLDAELGAMKEREATLVRERDAARAEAAETVRQAEVAQASMRRQHDDAQFELMTQVEKLTALLSESGIKLPAASTEPATDPQTPKAAAAAGGGKKRGQGST